MKSKIIIHNDSKLTDEAALLLAMKVVDEVPTYEYFEFNDGYKAQGVKTKTGKTIYIYGGKNAELIEENNSKIN